MKTSLTPQELVNKIQDHQQRAVDYRLTGSRLRAERKMVEIQSDGDSAKIITEPVITINNGNESETFSITSHAHTQIAQKLNVPVTYSKRIADTHPALWVDTLNTFFAEDTKDRTVRTMITGALDSPNDDGVTGDIRAVLGANYAIRDNDQILKRMIPILQDANTIANDYEILSSHLTYDDLYIKIASPRLTGEVETGDIVQGGFVISNSETGKGSTSIKPFLYRLVCKNGMIREDSKYNKTFRHIGQRMILNDDKFQRISQNTIDSSNEAFFSGLSDLMKMLLTPDVFAEQLLAMQVAAGREMNPQVKIPTFCERITKKLDLTGEESDTFLNELVRSPKMTQWHVANAVTAIANNIQTYERANYLEAAGSTVINMTENSWELLNAA